MVLARTRRLLLAAAVGTVALVPLVPAAPAHAGQVGVTISIRGAGRVQVVEGELSDGGSRVCDRSGNTDDRHVEVCPRVRSESFLEAWVWMRPVDTTEGFRFSRWEGCDVDRVRDGVQECMVRAGAFSGIEHYPVATFSERLPVVSDVRFGQGPEQGRVTLSFANTGVGASCQLDLADWQACGQGTSWVLPEGEHSLWVTGVNRSGRTGGYVEATLRVVDTDIFRGPPALTNVRTAAFGWSTGAGSSFECSLDGAPFARCGVAARAGSDEFDVRDGSHSWRVRARHGEWVDPTPAERTWTVDTVAPVTALGTTTVADGRAEIAFASDDAARHECRLVSTPPGPPSWEDWGPCGSPVVYDGLPDGHHVFSVRGVDAAGNAAEPASTSWGIDREPPDTSLVGGPAEGSFVLQPGATFTAGVDDERATLTCTLDGRVRPCAPGRLALTGLAAGTHVLSVGATDPAGNVDPTPATRTWTVPHTSAALARHGRWRAVRSAAAYGGTALTSRTRGASLTRRLTGARQVALVVGGGRGHGTVTVYAGRTLLRTVRLATGRTTARRVVRLADFRTPFTGTLRVVVTSTRRPVRIEGVGVRTR